VLLAGEAGVGKTRLADELAADAGTTVLRGRAVQGAAAPYGPVVAALRGHLHAHPGALDDPGPLRPHLALILPELGDPAPAGDRATLFEAVREALAHLARVGPVLLVLDDLQWSDDTTLELLAALAEPLGRMPVLALGAHRSDGLARDHPVRWLRNELRRGGRLEEVVLAPLAPGETGELVTALLGTAPAPSLRGAIHVRTQGVPFFVEELARALLATGALLEGPRGLELADGGQVPVPETVRDAVLLGASELSPDARRSAEAAAVAGESFDLAIVESVASAAGLAELVGRGVIREDGRGGGAFRHALTRETFSAEVPWLQRRALHRRLAEALEDGGGTSMEIATHWLGARDDARARTALLRAVEESRAVGAYRDAARAGRLALELWPDGEEPARRIEALVAYANDAELCGDMAGAARAWREICALRAGLGAPVQLAAAQRRLAAVHDLLGEAESAASVRREAAESYLRAGRPADAAVERLALADFHGYAADHSAAIALARAALAEADEAGRLDLRARALGMEGVTLARLGRHEEGLRMVQEGLALALEHSLSSVAPELYQRLGVALYNSAAYRRAQETLDTALDLCRDVDEPATELASEVCMVYVLRECGDWPLAMELGGRMLAGPGAWFAEGLLGAIHCLQGRLTTARRLVASSLAASSRVSFYNMVVDSTAALARVAAAEGDHDEALRRCRALLAVWESSEDHHYAVSGLRWAAGYLARGGALEDAHACAAALTRIASDTGHADALAAVAHAVGETALAAGDAATAAAQLARAAQLHRGLDIPYERAEIQLRAGVVLAAAGEREQALERLGDAHRTARRLGARPLAAEAAREVAALGEPVARRLGRRAAADADGAGLSRREVEVVRLLAAGRTNREIAEELVLSPRTVDMHVRNLLRKLDCRSRVEAARRAEELGLLVPAREGRLRG
jgi:DNA-binding CsgD family transcriptional regulator